ncbi:phage holin [Aerococcus christensenii]|uniref:Holin family protein n=1 Tax=Aerococcus christensenii TaxID=87541 RepID=A0A133XSY9_9LACT|nr:phage holin [Aerococcus christensenii]KXB34048.1 holin family protein [Aerococcus christensenii]MDK8234663.1 phage holin [Aerococcus christensenii]DAP05842.1 MAG TPA: holin [Caudoviricetes sp.]
MKLSNETYDLLKWGLLTVAPALMTLISALGVLYGWQNTELTVAVIGAVTTFLGTITGISSNNYNKFKK